NGHEVILFTGASKTTYTLCTHKKGPEVSKYILLQLFQMCLVACQLLLHLKAVKTYFKLEREQGSSSKRALEKIYLNSHLLKFKGDWLHFGFATLALERELVAKAIGAKMAVSFRGFDINVYPIKHPNCYSLVWKQVDKVHAVSSYLLRKAHNLELPKTIPYQIITPAVDFNNLPKVTFQAFQNTVKITTIARLNWIKGINYLVEVATCLKQENFGFEWQLIGSGNNSEIEQYVYHIHEKGVEEKVFIRGKYSHAETFRML